jgi:8-oxo-dGTP pyrophosphatase MutT (NUDIX family)
VAVEISRSEAVVSPWVRLVTRTVQLAPDRAPEVYHSLAQADYVTILARTPDGRFPIVQQYRPAVAALTWELPAGLQDDGESAEDTCRRELREEVGLEVRAIRNLGSYDPDTGRLENRLHVFWVETSDPDPGFVPESGMAIELVSFETLRSYVLAGRFRHQLHIGALGLAWLSGLLP